MRHMPFSCKSIIVVLAVVIAAGFYVGHKTTEVRQTFLIQRAAPSEAGI